MPDSTLTTSLHGMPWGLARRAQVTAEGRAMDNPLQIIGSLGGYLSAVIVAAIAWFPKKGSVENQMIDQYQERDEAREKRVAVLEGRIDRLEGMLVRAQRRDVAWELYVARIMIGAERGEFPPWPQREGILSEGIEGPE